MRNYILLIVLLLFGPVFTLNAQSVQRIRVMEYRGEGEKSQLADVEVVAGNAVAAVSDDQGSCSLQFRTLKPGDKINVRRIGKPGYELLNQGDVDNWFVSHNPADERVIVMASSKRLAKERKKYMLAAEKAIADDMAQQKAAIGKQAEDNQITVSEYAKKQKEIQEEYNVKLDAISDFIDHIVRIDVNEITERENEIMDLVKKGDMLTALDEYKKLDLLSSYKKQLERGAKLHDASAMISERIKACQARRAAAYNSILRQNSLYRIAGGKDNVEAGFKLWHDFAYTDTTYLLPLYGYARYCERSNRIADALDAVRYCFNTTDTVMLMRATLVYLQLKAKQNQYHQVTPQLERAFNYMDSVRIAKGDDSQFLSERAYALYLLSKSYTYLREYEKGRKVRQLLLDVNREAYEWDMNNLEQKRRYVDALYAAHHSVDLLEARDMDFLKEDGAEVLNGAEYLDLAIALQEELYGKHPVREAGMLAFLHSQKAEVYSDFSFSKNDTTLYSDIETEFAKTFDLYRVAYEHNSKAYAHFLAIAYLRYVRFLVKTDRLEGKDQALTLLHKAKEYNDEDMAINPDGSVLTGIYILTSEADLCAKYGDYAIAERCNLEAEEKLTPLFEQYPKTYWHYMLGVYNGLKRIYGPKALNNPDQLQKIEEKRKAHAEAYENLR